MEALYGDVRDESILKELMARLRSDRPGFIWCCDKLPDYHCKYNEHLQLGKKAFDRLTSYRAGRAKLEDVKELTT